jgi:hypothetical protein
MKKSQLKQLISIVLTEIQEHCSPYMEALQNSDEEGADLDVDITQDPEYQAMFAKWKAARQQGGGKSGEWDDDAGYDRNDPKHPDYAERMADQADRARAEKKDAGLYEAADSTKADSTELTTDIKDDIHHLDSPVALAKSPKDPTGPTSGLSGMKKEPSKEENTQMGKEDKAITSTADPKEKKESKKLPVKEKGSNTGTSHFAKQKGSGEPPKNEKAESQKRPVGGHGADKVYEGLKAEILGMVRQSLQEMARTKGAISTKDRVKNDSSPTGWVHRTTGEPVSPPSNTGKNYVKKGKVGMGRPKEKTPETEPDLGSEYSFTFIDPSEKKIKLDPDLPWYVGNQLTSYLEANVMAFTGDLQAKLDPKVVELLTAIKNRPEEVEAKHFIFRYSPSDHLLKVSAR